ncbi:MAG: hypothetical protein RBS43_00865 [Candidatus Cloacimonas sp.]|jgi:hypothetical protein|nr:hypothetical protein [Candidatus Cloacimonas sp.]
MRNIVIVLLALFVLSSCDLFKVRDSDPPGAAPPWNDFATTWEKALQNLEYCYEDSRNVVHYSGIFRTDYRFYFAPQDLSDYAIDPDWGKTQEQDMIQLVHSRYQNIVVELLSIAEQDEIGSNEAKIYREYSLTGIGRTSQNRETLATGNLEIHFRKEYGYWYIDKWYDYRATSGTTWGKLKHDNS